MVPREAEQVADTWLLSGIPRSGSSLCCRLADRLGNTVALSEPIDAAVFGAAADAPAACRQVVSFAAAARRRILEEGVAPSVQVDGRLADQMVAVARRGAPRPPSAERGLVRVAKPLAPDFRLVVKHNALFAALLPGLTSHLPCLSLVRNPVAVLASWETVDLPVRRGRVPAGERFDPALRASLDQEEDALRRRVRVLNWFFARYLAALPKERIIRYEELVRSGGGVLRQVLGEAGAGPLEELSNRNASALYQGVDAERLLAALLAAGGAWTAFYGVAECRRAAEALARPTSAPAGAFE